MRGSCISGVWTQGFSTIYMGKPVTSWFGQMVNRIQDWWILIPFGNRVYHLPNSDSFNEKQPREPETKIQNRFEDMKSQFPLEIFQPGKQECFFRRSVRFRNFSLKRRKQPETELMVSLAKHQSVLLVCFKDLVFSFRSKFWGFLSLTGLVLKTNLRLPVFWILKGDDAEQQNTVSRLRYSAVPFQSPSFQDHVTKKRRDLGTRMATTRMIWLCACPQLGGRHLLFGDYLRSWTNLNVHYRRWT